MITRADYMKNSSELHHDYYAQFLTDATTRFVLQNVTIEQLLASEDKWLNDVVPMRNQGWFWDHSPMYVERAREYGDNISKATRTCVGKTAARILIQEHKAQL